MNVLEKPGTFRMGWKEAGRVAEQRSHENDAYERFDCTTAFGTFRAVMNFRGAASRAWNYFCNPNGSSPSPCYFSLFLSI